MDSSQDNLKARFKKAISFKIYLVSLIIAALFLDLIVVLSMALFVSILHRGLNLLGDSNQNVIQIILGCSSALYILVYLVLAVLFIYMILTEFNGELHS